MGALEPLLNTLALFSIGFMAGINGRQYSEAKKWLDAHNIDYSFYEDKIKNRKNDSMKNSMIYYIGFPGRKLAYRRHSNKSD